MSCNPYSLIVLKSMHYTISNASTHTHTHNPRVIPSTLRAERKEKTLPLGRAAATSHSVHQKFYEFHTNTNDIFFYGKEIIVFESLRTSKNQ